MVVPVANGNMFFPYDAFRGRRFAVEHADTPECADSDERIWDAFPVWGKGTAQTSATGSIRRTWERNLNHCRVLRNVASS